MVKASQEYGLGLERREKEDGLTDVSLAADKYGDLLKIVQIGFWQNRQEPVDICSVSKPAHSWQIYSARFVQMLGSR